MAGIRRKMTVLNKPCLLLLVIGGMERFAFKGVAANLVTYLTDVAKMSNSTAAKTVNNWCGFTSMLPLLVAPLVDSYWNRYSTILASCSLYILGLAALTSTALERSLYNTNKSSNSSASLFWSLYIISLGQGGYNPSLQAFAADQLDHDDALPSSKSDQCPDKKRLFFQWWYFAICAGSLLGVTVNSYIQDTIGWGLGFAMPAIAMVISIVLFACGSGVYSYRQDMDSNSFDDLVRSVKAAASRIIYGKMKLNETQPDVVELELQEKPLCQGELVEKEGGMERSDGIYLVEIAKVVLRLLPIWTMLLLFAVIFQQPATFFTKQGMTMKRNVGSSFKIPPATLQSAITISIILLMPLYDMFFIPFARNLTGSEKGVTVEQRMGIGMFLSVIAMIIAAVVESQRLKICRKMEVSGSKLETVPFSIFWLLPQYILLGISDIFTVVGMQEFFYSEVPPGMRTMGIALYTSVFGVGSFVSAALISVVEYFSSQGGERPSWFSDDMSQSRLDNYYWLLAVSSAVSLLIFVVLCRFHISRTSSV